MRGRYYINMISKEDFQKAIDDIAGNRRTTIDCEQFVAKINVNSIINDTNGIKAEVEYEINYKADSNFNINILKDKKVFSVKNTEQKNEELFVAKVLLKGFDALRATINVFSKQVAKAEGIIDNYSYCADDYYVNTIYSVKTK